MMDFDATQAINISDFEEDTQDEEEGNKKPLGYLKVFSNRGFEERVFPVYEGDNNIGRDEKNEIAVPVKSLSKQHACIEVQADSHLIHDLSSRNKSRKGKLFLKPNVRYNVQHDDKFMLADMCCQYYYASQYKTLDVTNSGSDTGSELMLEGVDSDPALHPPQGDKEKDTSENSDAFDLSDCIQPTQAVPGDGSPHKNKTLSIKTPAAPRVGGVLAAESDDEDNNKKDAADVSRVEDSGSDTDADVYAEDTEDFSVPSDELAVAPTQACLPHDAPTQPVNKTKKTLTFDMESDSESDDLAVAPTQACMPTQPAGKTTKSLTSDPESDSESGTLPSASRQKGRLEVAERWKYPDENVVIQRRSMKGDMDDEGGKSLFLAETQAFAGGGVTSDQDEDSDDDRGKSLFEAATQAVLGVQSDESDQDEDDNERGTSLYDAATQALHYSDSADETINNGKRVSIASTVVLNESSDLEWSAKKPRPSMSPKKLSMLRLARSTPVGKEARKDSFVFGRPGGKKKLEDIRLYSAESEDTDIDESFDKKPFTTDENDETLPPCEDDFIAETQDISDYEGKHSILEQSGEEGTDDQEEHATVEGDKTGDPNKDTPNKSTPESSKLETLESELPVKNQPTDEESELTTAGSEKGGAIEPTVRYDLQRSLSEKSKDSDSGTVGDDGLTVAPTVPYQLSRELTGESSDENTPAETVVQPIEMCRSVEGEGEPTGVEGGSSGVVEETQAYGGDPDQKDQEAETCDLPDRGTEASTGETQAYDGELGGTEISDQKGGHLTGANGGDQTIGETLAYGSDLEGTEKSGVPGKDGRDAGLAGEWGMSNQGQEETQAYGMGRSGIGGETLAYGGEDGDGAGTSSRGEREQRARMECSSGLVSEGKSGTVEETQAYGEGEDPAGLRDLEKKEEHINERGTEKDGHKEVEETQAYGLEETIRGPLGGDTEGHSKNLEDGRDVRGIQGAEGSGEVEETQAYGLDGAVIGGLDGGKAGLTGGPGEPMEVEATQPYGLGGQEMEDGRGAMDRPGPMNVEATQAYGGDEGIGGTLAYGDVGDETQVPDSQELGTATTGGKNDLQKDSVFAEQDGNLAEGAEHPDVVETDAAPQRRKSGDEGLLKRRRSSQSLQELDKPDRGGLLSSLKKKVRFGRKKKSSSSESGSSAGSSRSSSRSSRSSTGSKEGEAGVVGDEGVADESRGGEQEGDSLSLLDDVVLEESEPEVNPSPSKKRRIATIERPDLEAIKRSGSRGSDAKEKGAIDKDNSEKGSEEARSDRWKSARQRRNATITRPNVDLLTTPEREGDSVSGKSGDGSVDTPDGSAKMNVVKEKGGLDLNNNRRGKRGARSKVTDDKREGATIEESGGGRGKRATRGKAKTQEGSNRRGRAAAVKKGGVSDGSSKESRLEGKKELDVDNEKMDEPDQEGDGENARNERVAPEANDSPDSSVLRKGRTTRGKKGAVKDASGSANRGTDSTVVDQEEAPVRASSRGQTQERGREENKRTPAKTKRRAKAEEMDAPIRKSSRMGGLEQEEGDIDEAAPSGRGTRGKKQGKDVSADVTSEEKGDADATVTSTTTVSCTGGARNRGASAESKDGPAKESQQEEQPLPVTRGTRGRAGPKTGIHQKSMKDYLQVESSSTTQGTRNGRGTGTTTQYVETTKPIRSSRSRKASGSQKEEESVPDSQESLSSRKATRTWKGASAERTDESVAAPTKIVTSTRTSRGRKGAKMTVDDEADNDSTASATSSRGSRSRNASAEGDSLTNSSEQKSEPKPTSSRASRGKKTTTTAENKTESVLSKPPRKGHGGVVDDDDDSVSSTLSLDSVPREGDFTQPTPVKGRRGRRAKPPALKVEDSSPVRSEEGSPVAVTPSTGKRGRGKANKSSEKPSTLEITSTPSRAAARRSAGTPRSSPTLAEGSSPSLRRRSSEPRPKVMFTGVIDKSGEKVVSSLGGILTDSVLECTHLVTDKVRRTVKFLCCLSRGALIVTPTWLEQSKIQQRFVEAAEFMLSDKVAEKQHKFSLLNSHERAKEGTLLSGWKIHATPGVKPDPSQMKDIIRSAGGEFLSRVPCQHQDNTVVVSCEDDASRCLPAVVADIPIVTAEFLLTGLLRQEVDVDGHRLSVNAAAGSSTPAKKSASGSSPAKKTTSRSRSRRK